ncbi:MAG TPA: PRC-barrel domain-containing protein [Planctomycetaceae bacterium]|nr:PRC-barrel domain-containing protein [Planctomycetaceae bacterium]
MTHRNLFVLAAAALLVAATSQSQAQEAVRKPDAAAAANAEKEGRVTRVRDLIGLEVVNEAGESYGMIEDLLVNKTSGTIEFALVASEKESKELYPLPWKALTLYQGETAEDQYVILGMQREQFVKAPTIARQAYPTMTYSQWNTTYVPQVTAYYGPVRPAPARAVRRTARAVRRAVD